MRRETIDLEEEAREIREEQVAEIEEAEDELVERLEEEYDGFSDVPDRFKKTYEQFEEQLVELRGRAQALENAAEEWGDGVFVISELTTGQVATIQDRVSEESFDFDPEAGEMVDGTPKQGYGMVETLRQAVVEQPSGAPTSSNPKTGRDEPEPAEYPSQVGMYLFEKVNNLNTVGDTDLGNSSLRDRMSG